MHGTGVLCVITAHWVFSDTHTIRAMLIKIVLLICDKIRMLQK